MTFKLCEKQIIGRSKFEKHINRKCYLEDGHSGRCYEYGYLSHLKKVAPRVANKIVRDSTKTTGAAWKSDDAGPNRIDRWVMLLSDEDLMGYGINIPALKPTVVAKLRDKAATYEECMDVAINLTRSIYQMQGAPRPTSKIEKYLSKRLGGLEYDSTRCIVCLEKLNFNLFAGAQRGRANLETAHANPRSHHADNVGFAHRECNIAQGSLSLKEFYSWIESILSRVNKFKKL